MTHAATPYLLFDLGNVLIDLDIPATYQALASLTEQQAEPFRVFLEEHEWLQAYETGRLSDEAFLDGILPFTAPGTTPDTLRAAWNAMLLGVPASRLSWLEGLRRLFPVGLLSNTNGLHLAWVHQYLHHTHGVSNFEERYFNDVFYSHHIGAKKPDAESYRHVLEALGIPAGQIIFIDDLEENVQAARDCGLRAMQHPAGAEIMTCLPDYLEACGWLMPTE